MEPWSLLLSFVAIAITCCMLFAYDRLAYLPKLKEGQAPYPKGNLGLPLLGHTLELFRDFKHHPDNFVRKRIARFGKAGGLFKTHIFGSPTIMATTPETLRAIAMDGQNFGPNSSLRRLVGGQSFLVLHGKNHKMLRRLASLAISSPNTLNNLMSLVENLTDQALHKWSNMGEFPLIDELLKLSFDIIATLIVGKLESKDIEEFCHEFHDLNVGLRAFPVNLPGFAYHRALKASRKLQKRIQAYIDNRIKDNNVVHGDVLESLMTTIDDEGNKLSSEQIIDSIIAFMLAGHESSAHTAMWIIIFLSKNPDKLQKLMEEQTRISTEERNSQQHLSVFDYKKMTYLSSVIDETLRIVNISPFTIRRCMRMVEVNGYTIPQNWSVALWFRANHMNEEFFPNPYTFNPERWKDIKLKIGMYAPFGLGARSCIGMDLAKLELAVLVHKMVLNYRWELMNPNASTVYLPRAKPSDNCPILISKK